MIIMTKEQVVPSFELIVTGEVREVYEVEADSAEEARAKFENGELLDPVSHEVTSVDEVEVREFAEPSVVRPRKPRR